MTILSAQSIRVRAASGVIAPFYERTTNGSGLTFGLSPAGYDIRLREWIQIPANGFALGSSVERFMMPSDLLARITDKSTLARRGICVQNTVIEPGWMGFLTLEISNHSEAMIELDAETPIAQVLFELLDQPTTEPYQGRYQNQAARPVAAKYLGTWDR